MAAKRKAARPHKKDTPAAQHKRFLEAAREAGASKDPKDFDKAFKRVASPSFRDTSGSSR